MRFAFVTSELAPHTPGGAGAVVSELARGLAELGHEVSVLVIGHESRPTDEAFEIVWAPIGDESPDRFSAVSGLAAQTLADRAGAFDVVEFVDFDALAYDSLVDRRTAGLENTVVCVRMHGPADLMFEAVGTTPSELIAVIAREREIYRMADAVIAPSSAMKDLIVDRYSLDGERVLIGVPPLSPVPWAALHPAPRPEVVCFGRLAEVKGSHDLLGEMIPLLERRPDVTLRFVGQDGWSAEAGIPMREWLSGLTPPGLRHRIRFDGAVARDDLGPALASAWMVVIPSRFESYCLAADEVRHLGHPLIVRDLPAFRDRLGPDVGVVVVPVDEPGALRRAVDGLIDAADARRSLGEAPPPPRGDWRDPYSAGWPPVRHPRSQSGLATAAVQRVERALPAEAPRRVRAVAERLARQALAVLPDSLARMAVRVLPGSVKDRFRQVASWRVEAERRDRERAHREIRDRIRMGAFPDLEDPAVTVVIPCYNQGGYLEDAILSVFRQTSDDWEIVVVDDGSDDHDTVAMLAELDWPRVRVIRRDNGGLPAARNTGIAVARGRFVVPLDADDELAPRYLERMTEALDAAPRAAYAHCWAELFGDRSEVWVSRPFNEYQLLVSNSVIGCVTLRRDSWEAVGGYDESMVRGNEDWELWVRLMEAGWDQVEVPLPLFRYRKHGVSMSVETESRFEEGLGEIRERHPALYDPAALRRRKRAHYPLVSIIGEGATAPSDTDVQLVAGGETEAVLLECNGKYVVWAEDPIDPEEIERVARDLEARPGMAAAPCGGSNLWRRWALLDRNAPVETPDDLNHRDPLSRVRLDVWSVPEDATIPGLAVVRQEVETAGFLGEGPT